MYFIEVYLIVLIYAVQHSESVIHVYVPFKNYFPLWLIIGY